MSLYASSPREVLSQGDILKDVALDEPRRKRFSRVIVMSHSCEIDKPDGKTCIVAELMPLQSQGKKYSERIRGESHKILNVFYLPAHPRLVESFADFRYLFRVYFADIGAENWKQVGDEQHRALADHDRRLVSLTDEGAHLLATKLAYFFRRPDLDPVPARTATG